LCVIVSTDQHIYLRKRHILYTYERVSSFKIWFLSGVFPCHSFFPCCAFCCICDYTRDLYNIISVKNFSYTILTFAVLYRISFDSTWCKTRCSRQDGHWFLTERPFPIHDASQPTFMFVCRNDTSNDKHGKHTYHTNGILCCIIQRPVEKSAHEKSSLNEGWPDDGGRVIHIHPVLHCISVNLPTVVQKMHTNTTIDHDAYAFHIGCPLLFCKHLLRHVRHL